MTTPPARSVTETEMNALLKKHQQPQGTLSQQPKITTATVIASSNSSSIQTQFITAPVTATAGKTAVGIPLPTVSIVNHLNSRLFFTFIRSLVSMV